MCQDHRATNIAHIFTFLFRNFANTKIPPAFSIDKKLSETQHQQNFKKTLRETFFVISTFFVGRIALLTLLYLFPLLAIFNGLFPASLFSSF